MSLAKHYLQTAADLCRQFDATIPFPVFLKRFFSLHKKYGSRDRKMISGLCYAFYRLGKITFPADTEERMKLGWFLVSAQSNSLLLELNEEWNNHAGLSAEEKLTLANLPFQLEEIAPFQPFLSEGIQSGSYCNSFLTQPDVFVRTRPGKKNRVISKLDALEWEYMLEDHSCIRLPASSAIDKHFRMNDELVVQDLNSQKVGNVIRDIFSRENFKPRHVWDCCAASGGKSIMLEDSYPGIHLNVSDVRSSILHNLQKRFKEAGIQQYHSFETDLSKPDNNLHAHFKTKVHFIIADVPCTGSGTWSRTPEQLYFFKEQLIDEYAAKQFAIASNALSVLEPGGYFVYITCSVFKKENEENVAKLMQHHALQLIASKMLDGTKEKADSMYVAVLRKSALPPY